MNLVATMYALAAGAVLGLALLAVSGRRPAALRWAAVGLAALFVVVGAVAVSLLAGRPRPVLLGALAAGEATVLSHRIVEGRAIYLWVQRDGDEEPLALALPWNRETAEELARAAREAEERNGRARMRYEPSLEDREPRFYPPPQPALPPKEEPSAPQWYRHPEADT